MVYIRNFERKDLEGVQRIAELSLKENYSRELYLTIHRSWNGSFLVALEGQKPVGFISGLNNPDDGGSRILMLSVHPKYRRRGIGSSLLNTFVESSSKLGASYISLEVRPNNRDAREFYRKRGFEEVDVIDDFYTNGESCIKMVRYL